MGSNKDVWCNGYHVSLTGGLRPKLTDKVLSSILSMFTSFLSF